MSELILKNENIYKKKSLRFSIGFHILLLLLSLWHILKDDPNQNIDKQYAVSIAFDNFGASNSFKGVSAEGAQRKKNETVDRVKQRTVDKINTEVKPKPIKKPKVQTPPTPPVTTAPTESEIFEEEAKIEAVQKAEQKKAKPTPKPQKPQKVEQVEAVEAVEDNSNDEIAEVPSNVPASSSNSSDNGNNSSSPSNQDGKGTGQGKQGKGSGSDKSGNDSTSGIGTGGTGQGAFDGSGKGIFGRYPVKRPSLSQLKIKNGRISFKVCIDREGKPTFVNVIKRGTTIRDKKTQIKAIDWMYNFIWEEDYKVAKEQCGKYTLIFENSAN